MGLNSLRVRWGCKALKEVVREKYLKIFVLISFHVPIYYSLVSLQKVFIIIVNLSSYLMQGKTNIRVEFQDFGKV